MKHKYSRSGACCAVLTAVIAVTVSIASAEPPVSESAAADVSVEPSLRGEQELFVERFGVKVKESAGAMPASTPPKPPPSARAPKSRILRSQISERHQYTGYVAQSAVSVSITQNGRTGRVEGDLYFLRSPTRLYTLAGRKLRDDRLRLMLLDEAIPIAAVTLYRSTDSSTVRWTGKLRDKDGKGYEFFLSKSLKADIPTHGPKTVAEFDALKGFTSYQGTVKDRTVKDRRRARNEAFFKLRSTGLKWRGFYYQRYLGGKTSKILELEGEQIRPEELTLQHCVSVRQERCQGCYT